MDSVLERVVRVVVEEDSLAGLADVREVNGELVRVGSVLVGVVSEEEADSTAVCTKEESAVSTGPAGSGVTTG